MVVLPVPGGPQKDQGPERAGAQHPGQRTLVRQKVILTNHFVKLLRPHPVGKRARSSVRQSGSFEQIAHRIYPLRTICVT